MQSIKDMGRLVEVEYVVENTANQTVTMCSQIIKKSEIVAISKKADMEGPYHRHLVVVYTEKQNFTVFYAKEDGDVKASDRGLDEMNDCYNTLMTMWEEYVK